jgi:hypothetical protein
VLFAKKADEASEVAIIEECAHAPNGIPFGKRVQKPVKAR